MVDTENFLLLREGESFEYTLYFKIGGNSIGGYCREMFNGRARRPMCGAKEFVSRGFELIDMHKGRAAWNTFFDRLQLEQYEKQNSFTNNFALNREQLQKIRIEIPEIGTL